MTTGRYGRRALLELCGGTEGAVRALLPWHVLKDDGLWLAQPEPGLTPAERDVMQWHAWGDSERPALPVPFTAHELAAFMLAGGGLGLFDAYDCGTEPDAEALLGLGQNAGKAREAYRVAHQLVLDANERFGRTDDGVRRAAQWLIDAGRDDSPEEDSQRDVQEQQREPAPAAPQPLQRQRAQEEEILVALRAAGHDPQRLPAPLAGKACQAKAVARSRCPAMTPAVFDKAWQRLRSVGAIRNDAPSTVSFYQTGRR